MATPETLARIMEHKLDEVDRAKRGHSIRELEAAAADTPEPRGFVEALTTGRRHPTAVIAEVKRRSPSAGLIRPEYDGLEFSPESIAQRYETACASAISCLTDEKFFGGDPAFIRRIKENGALPVLRKDFILDPWQIAESRAIGADAVLLIAECLDDARLADLHARSLDAGLDVLLEVHDAQNLDRALSVLDAAGWERSLLGINNRDLSTMTVDLDHSIRLSDQVTDPSRLVSESGIKTPDDLVRLREAGIGTVLVGEHLMRADDPGKALGTLLV